MGHPSHRRCGAPEPSTNHDPYGGASTRLSHLVLMAAAAACVAVAIAPAAAWARPAVDVRDTTVAIGATTVVTGTGWPAQTLVDIDTCGNLGLDGSADCTLTSALNVGTTADGRFSAVFTIAQPPSPCPCVVRVNTLDFSQDARAPITIPGAPTSDPGTKVGPPEIARYLRLGDVHLEGTPPWTRWFGAGYWRTLVVTITNIGDASVDTPQLSVTFGTSEHPTGVVEAPELAAIAPGQRTIVRIPVHVDGLSIGTHHVRAEVSGFGRPASATVSTSTYPWGLLAVAIVVAQLVLLGVRNWVRRHVHRDADEVDDDAPPAATLDVVDVADDDAPDGGADVEPVGPAPALPLDLTTTTVVRAPTEVAQREEQTNVMTEDDHSLASVRATLVDLLTTVDGLIARRSEADDASAEVHRARAEADALRLEARDVLERAHTEAREIVEQARRSVLDALGAIRDPAPAPEPPDHPDWS